MAITVRGGQLHGLIKRTESFTGLVAPIGQNTILPFTLIDNPISNNSVAVYLGTVSIGDNLLQQQGAKYSVNINTKQITWLSSATFGLIPSNILLVTYYTQGNV